MDMSDKDEFAAKKGDLVDTPVDWRISDSNPIVLYPPENPMSAPSQMMDSFRQNLWHDGGFNVHTDAGTSFRGNVDRPLEMGWNMAQFPSDSGFIERAAKFSFFGCGSFGEMMMNQQSHGVPESTGLFVQDTQIASGSKLGNGPSNKDASKVVKDGSNGLSNNVSEDSQSSGGNGHDAKCMETSSKDLNTKKRKRTGKVEICSALLYFVFCIFWPYADNVSVGRILNLISHIEVSNLVKNKKIKSRKMSKVQIQMLTRQTVGNKLLIQ